MLYISPIVFVMGVPVMNATPRPPLFSINHWQRIFMLVARWLRRVGIPLMFSIDVRHGNALN